MISLNRIRSPGCSRWFCPVRSQEADACDALVEVFLPAEDVDLDAEEEEREVAAVEARHADGVFSVVRMYSAPAALALFTKSIISCWL